MTLALYNEIEPYAAQWLRNLVAAGHIAGGDVDERSIRDVRGADLAGRVQCHFFAGIGVWSYALRLAGWPDGAPVWTGSCPCQPFSGAGRRRGFDDERHLWPEWFRLIRECRPPTIFGEQVASPDGLGWLDAVFADLEHEGYACGAADLCAAGVGAPHRRQRLFFVAHSTDLRREHMPSIGGGIEAGEKDRWMRQSARSRDARLVGDASGARGGRDTGAVRGAQDGGAGARGAARGLADEPIASGPTRGAWADADWLPCRDGKARPVEPGTFPLAHGAPARVGRLRAYGNAIVPQVAATFIRAAMWCEGGRHV